ncbi:MAG TPA: pyrroloquinoline quinone-dependent dehydrogenase, partial [Rhizomicrobium sp.]|nr:pyrroloquinoline quinone-dependent dehydrogenase [Rhizomicrobium sp.]
MRTTLSHVAKAVTVAALLIVPQAVQGEGGAPPPAPAAGWGYYGGDAGGQRFSPARQITPANVAKLQIAWTYSNGDLTSKGEVIKRASFENTPILAEGRLYTCSAFNEVAALDPGTGKQLWSFDPKLDTTVRYPNDYICRSVAFTRVAPGNGACAARIYLNTADRRLIALDAASGKPCAGFGIKGTVALPIANKTSSPAAYVTLMTEAEAHRLGLPKNQHFPPGLRVYLMHAKDGSVVGYYRLGSIHTTSAPVITHGVVIVGSSIDDNQRVDELRGTVHAFDVATGKLKWSFDPLAEDKPPYRAGAANVWAPMSVDEQRGLVFLPVSSASPDFFGGLRRGNGKYANSIVALHVADGTVAWSFQTTHHDVWDYDLPAQPTLGMVTYNGKTQPAVIQPTKQGLVFTVNRDTGAPVIPVVERKVPQDKAAGEQLSPTQPFPVAPRPLAPIHIKPDDAFGLTFWDRGKCHDAIAAARNEGLYTPPSEQGTILYPFTGGGTNWGGLAFDAAHDIVYVNTSAMIHVVTLIRQRQFGETKEKFFDKEVSPQEGAPFGMMRAAMLSPIGMPCNPPPWGQLHAVDMHSGKVLWSVPLGTTEDMAPFSQYILGTKTGTPNLGGPMVTAGGLVFIGAAMDNYLRAFDAKSGAELWKGRLPAGGQATPMTYTW